jgi:hypothetical protein
LLRHLLGYLRAFSFVYVLAGFPWDIATFLHANLLGHLPTGRCLGCPVPINGISLRCTIGVRSSGRSLRCSVCIRAYGSSLWSPVFISHRCRFITDLFKFSLVLQFAD